MKRKLATIYAAACTLLLVAGFLLVFYFALNEGTVASLKCLLGLVGGFILSPILHELGHVSFAILAKMDYVYVKCFCFKIYLKDGKKRFGFASPFLPDETQVLPKKGGDMKKRATLYSLGGLVYSGIFFALILVGAVLTACFGKPSYVLFGMLPYTAYLFFLNLPPFEYASGKTDALVYRGIRKGCAAELCMLSAMEIQGQLTEGKSFAEIDEKYYFDLPQLCEEEPLFAVLQDLRYRYYIEQDNKEKAADHLNRLAQAQVYLSETEMQKVAAELTYMHALLGNFEEAEESGNFCREYLSSSAPSAKRILAAYSAAFGKMEAVALLKEQALEGLKKERILGVEKFEKILLSRIDVE